MTTKKLNGYKVVNESNGKEEIRVFQSEADQITFDDAVYQIKIGHWAVLPDWDMVEDVLGCFDNNDDFIIEQVGNTFYIGKPESNRVLNRLEKLKEAYAKGEIFDIDER